MQGMTLALTLTEDQMAEIAHMVADLLPPRPIDRHAAMVERLGEVCTVEQASEALNVSKPTVYRMISNGKLRTADIGIADVRVDVRSMAELLEGKRPHPTR